MWTMQSALMWSIEVDCQAATGFKENSALSQSDIWHEFPIKNFMIDTRTKNHDMCNSRTQNIVNSLPHLFFQLRIWLSFQIGNDWKSFGNIGEDK